MHGPAPLVREEYDVPDSAYELGRPLTGREREVLALFAEGLGTDAAATRLSISRVTIRNHAQRILAKLGVHSRLAAVARGRESGLLGGEPPRKRPGPPR
jgi:ATP/maltotriose-dependent transcriptional regulator MalT